MRTQKKLFAWMCLLVAASFVVFGYVPQYQQGGAYRGSTSAFTGTNPYQSYGQSHGQVNPAFGAPYGTSQQGPVTSKEIDEVWKAMDDFLDLVNVQLDTVWLPDIGWKDFEEVYFPAPAATPSIPPSSQPSTSSQPSSQTRSTDDQSLGASGQVGSRKSKSEATKCFEDNYGSYNAGTVQRESVKVGGKTFAVNAKMAAALRKVAVVVEQNGYKIHSGNSCRSGTPSCGNFHASCLSIDINPHENPHCPKWAGKPNWLGRVPSEAEREKCRGGEIVTDIPKVIVDAFESNGFYWGGRFNSPDSMHFEYIGEGTCCSRTYKALSYTPTSDTTFASNPRCLWGKDSRGFCKGETAVG